MEEYRALAPRVISSIILSLLVWAAAPAADCNLNGIQDDLDLTLPVLRAAELPVPFSDELAWGQPLAVDLNGDGLPDLAALEGPELSDGGSDYAIWINRGGGRFDVPARYSTGTIGRWATAADLDGDGDPDLVTVTNELMTILIGLNDGEGRMSDPLRSWGQNTRGPYRAEACPQPRVTLRAFLTAILLAAEAGGTQFHGDDSAGNALGSTASTPRRILCKVPQAPG